MGKYTTLLDWENQDCQNDHTTQKKSTDSMQSLLNYQWNFSENKKKYVQHVWKHKRPQTAKEILKKKNRA